MVDLTLFEGYHHVPKEWGEEIWLCNTSGYCSKLLYVKPGMQCSLHYHPIKEETFVVLEGKPLLRYGHTQWEEKHPGDSFHVPTGTPHRFAAIEGPALLLEVSTRHDDSDVVRLEPSGSILPF